MIGARGIVPHHDLGCTKRCRSGAGPCLRPVAIVLANLSRCRTRRQHVHERSSVTERKAIGSKFSRL